MRWIDDEYKNISITTDSLPSASSEALGSWLYENASQIWSTLPTPKASLQLYSWKEIKQIGDALSAGIINISTVNLTYNITLGQTKTVIMNNESHTCRLIGILHDKSISGSVTYLGFTFEILDLLDTKMALYDSASVPNASWRESNIRNYLVSTMPSITDPELIAVISIAAKQCCASVASSTPQYYDQQKFWILSETELTGVSSHTISGQSEGTQYEFYRDYASRADYIKELDGVATAYWLRSPYEYNSSTGNSSFACIINTGITSINTVSSSIGVSPCFCIGLATFYSLSSIFEDLSGGSHTLKFLARGGSPVIEGYSNILYLYKDTTPTEDVYFITSTGDDFTVKQSEGSSQYVPLVVGNVPIVVVQVTVNFVPDTTIYYSTDGGTSFQTVTTATTLILSTSQSSLIFKVPDGDTTTKILVTDNNGTIITRGKRCVVAVADLTEINVTQEELVFRELTLVNPLSQSVNYYFEDGYAWGQWIAEYGSTSATNFGWDSNTGYVYYRYNNINYDIYSDSARTIHVNFSDYMDEITYYTPQAQVGYTIVIVSDGTHSTVTGNTYFKINSDTCSAVIYDGWVEPDGTLLDSDGVEQSSMSFSNVEKIAIYNSSGAEDSSARIAVAQGITYYLTRTPQVIPITQNGGVAIFGVYNT